VRSIKLLKQRIGRFDKPIVVKFGEVEQVGGKHELVVNWRTAESLTEEV
jgi:hypothetical protein